MAAIRNMLNQVLLNFYAHFPSPTYSFEHDTVASLYNIKLKQGGPLLNCHKHQDKFQCFFLDSISGNRLACVWIKNYVKPKFTLLFSHGGTVDLGSLVNFLFVLSQRLTINIVIYDYSGFGESSGRASEKIIFQDGRSVYDHVVKTVPVEELILYGQSMGTAVTLHLASRCKSPVAKAIILHSPFLSAAKLYFPQIHSGSCRFYDFFRNVEMIRKTELPILILHGTKDIVAPIEHSHELYELIATKVKPCWIEGGGHDDLYAFDAYMKRLKRFFEFDLEQFTSDL